MGIKMLVTVCFMSQSRRSGSLIAKNGYEDVGYRLLYVPEQALWLPKYKEWV